MAFPSGSFRHACREAADFRTQPTRRKPQKRGDEVKESRPRAPTCNYQHRCTSNKTSVTQPVCLPTRRSQKRAAVPFYPRRSYLLFNTIVKSLQKIVRVFRLLRTLVQARKVACGLGGLGPKDCSQDGVMQWSYLSPSSSESMSMERAENKRGIQTVRTSGPTLGRCSLKGLSSNLLQVSPT